MKTQISITVEFDSGELIERIAQVNESVKYYLTAAKLTSINGYIIDSYIGPNVPTEPTEGF
jgi:hypothetical protein